MNLALYRKYRPKRFSEIIGQQHIVQTIGNAISLGMVSHAYLFAGPRGSGKTTMARILAKAINCQNRKDAEFEPCNQCSSCLEINEGRSLDLVEIDAASHRGIDEIRDLKNGIKFAPNKLKYKVFIIDECHQLSKDAANALLKILEEPPSYTVFILATTEVHKMIPTIVSRCQRFDFRKLTVPEIIQKLEKISKEEKIKITKAALEVIALNSGGAVRDAESLLDQVFAFAKGSDKEINVEDVKDLLGIVEMKLVAEFCSFILEKKSAEAIRFINQLFDKGLDIQEFANSLINYLRMALIFKITGGDNQNPILKGLTREEFKMLEDQARAFKENELRHLLNIVLDAENKMRYSPIPQLPLELATVEFIDLKG